MRDKLSSSLTNGALNFLSPASRAGMPRCRESSPGHRKTQNFTCQGDIVLSYGLSPTSSLESGARYAPLRDLLSRLICRALTPWSNGPGRNRHTEQNLSKELPRSQSLDSCRQRNPPQELIPLSKRPSSKTVDAVRCRHFSFLLTHHRHRGACCVYHAVKACVHDRLEVLRAHLLERRKLPVTGIVDQRLLRIPNFLIRFSRVEGGS